MITAKPAVRATHLATGVVRRIVESYRHTGQDATQSAIDLTKLDERVEEIHTLARRTAALPRPALDAALRAAWLRTLRLLDNTYVDLHHFASNLAAATKDRTLFVRFWFRLIL